MHAAVVELDPLSDPVRARADHDDGAARRLGNGVLALVREVEVRRPRLELGRARVDGEPAGRRTTSPHLGFVDAEHTGDPRVGETEALRARDVAILGQLPLGFADRLELGQEVRVRAGELRQLVSGLAPLERLQERLREGAAEAERLADGAHLRAELTRRTGELFEVEARRLDRDVVEGRLEGSRRLARDVVRQLVERVADGEQRRQLRDREPGRLRGERRGAGDARVHLDQGELARLGLVRELHVRAAGRDADRARTRERRLAEPLELGVGERLLGRDRPRVARVDAHRIDVLDRADDDAVAGAIAHHLELVLLPAGQRALDEHLAGGTRCQSELHLTVKL